MTAITIDGKLLDVIQETVYGDSRKHNLQVINKYLEKKLGKMWNGKGSFIYVPSSNENLFAMSGILIVNDKTLAFKAMALGNLTMDAFEILYNTKN
tara:strand:- start:413 stop:700 length:288 start_codon:yes stop_codon:yes gene_type:complete